MKRDPHSQTRPDLPRVVHTDWSFGLDFVAEALRAAVTHRFDRPGRTRLDTSGLDIIAVRDLAGNDLAFKLGRPHIMKGTCLTITVPADCHVRIEYTTSPKAHGIQWMSPELAGGKPFVYTQGQAINARSYIPCQDTPSNKFTLTADVRVPNELRGLIAAAEHVDRIPCDDNQTSIEYWRMPFPITTYLIAFAVGDLVSRDLSERSRVWAQPHMIERAALEFKDIEKLTAAVEAIAGPDPFVRADMLVMPDAFPYGGMENPCCMFLTPALVTGDGSGLSTVGHERAHALTGNLVTNADWDAFWLNEGWTVWLERRIGELVFGRDEAMVHLKLLSLEFAADLVRFRKADLYQATALCHGLHHLDPDDVFGRPPYFKGEEMLRLIEYRVGRPRFDAFLRSYIEAFRFRSIDTADFLAFLAKEFGEELLAELRIREWVYEPGPLPNNALLIQSSSIAEVEEAIASGQVPRGEGWSMPQWQLYLELLPREQASRDFIAELNMQHDLLHVKHPEVQCSFLTVAIRAGFEPALAVAKEFLHRQGRMKFLNPLYGAIAETYGRVTAETIFGSARTGYHPVAIKAVDRVLAVAA